MKLAFLGVVAGERDSPVLRAYEDLVLAALKKVKSSETEVDVFHLRRGLTCLEEYFYSYTTFLNDREYLEGLVELQHRGYDGIMIGCFFDPTLREARQVLNMPVVGPAQSSLLLATLMGRKVGIITISPEAALEMDERFARYGLAEKLVRSRSINASAGEQVAAMSGGKALEHEWERFQEAGREAIKEGAEVLVPGCLLMAPNFSVNGHTMVDGVPVIDVMGCLVKTAEALVSMKNAGSQWISRVCMYSDNREVFEQARKKFPYLGSGIFSHKDDA